MIEQIYFKIAWKMLYAVSAPVGTERVLYKTDWRRQGIYMRDEGRVVTPTDAKVRAALIGLIKSRCVAFRNVGEDKVGITILEKEK